MRVTVTVTIVKKTEMFMLSFSERDITAIVYGTAENASDSLLAGPDAPDSLLPGPDGPSAGGPCDMIKIVTETGSAKQYAVDME